MFSPHSLLSLSLSLIQHRSALMGTSSLCNWPQANSACFISVFATHWLFLIIKSRLSSQGWLLLSRSPGLHSIKCVYFIIVMTWFSIIEGLGYLDCLLDHRDELEESVSGCNIEQIVSSTKQVERLCRSLQLKLA